MKYRFLFMAVLAMSLSACGTKKFLQVEKIHYEPDEFNITRYSPEVGVESISQVGDAVMFTYRVSEIPAVVNAAPFRHLTKYRDTMAMSITVPAGTFTLSSVDEQGGRFYSAPAGVALAYESKGVFGDDDQAQGGFHVSKTGVTSVYWSWPKQVYASLSPDPAIALKRSTVDLWPKTSGFRRELVYSGTSQGAISLLYREFVNDTARPAFAQELKYDAAKGTVIGFQGARLEVIEANNTSIKYRVIASLPAR